MVLPAAAPRKSSTAASRSEPLISLGLERVGDHAVTGRSGGSIGHITIRTMNGLGLGRGQNHHALLDAQIVDGDAFFTGGRFQRSRLIHMRDANVGQIPAEYSTSRRGLDLGSKN